MLSHLSSQHCSEWFHLPFRWNRASGAGAGVAPHRVGARGPTAEPAAGEENPTAPSRQSNQGSPLLLAGYLSSLKRTVGKRLTNKQDRIAETTATSQQGLKDLVFWVSLAFKYLSSLTTYITGMP